MVCCLVVSRLFAVVASRVCESLSPSLSSLREGDGARAPSVVPHASGPMATGVVVDRGWSVGSGVLRWAGTTSCSLCEPPAAAASRRWFPRRRWMRRAVECIDRRGRGGGGQRCGCKSNRLCHHHLEHQRYQSSKRQTGTDGLNKHRKRQPRTHTHTSNHTPLISASSHVLA